MKVHFFGASGEVTGSCYLVEYGDNKLLVDCGLFQGTEMADERSHAAFPFDPTELSAVIVTHAHIDHCGRVPQLFARGYRGPVYATEPTGDLITLQWDDMLSLMQQKYYRENRPMLFEEADMTRAVRAIVGMPYEKSVDVLGGARVTFHDAGHIFGSSWVSVEYDHKTVVFSGDIGNDGVPIIRETSPLIACDMLVTEATYGDRTHESTTRRREQLRGAIIEAIKRGGAMMIAAFSIERTQEVLYELDQLIERERALPRIPIYLDSPLAIRANEVYKRYTSYYDEAASAEWRRGNNFFEFPGLHTTLTVAQSKVINSAPNPKVIIAGSGMLSGGRITHHLMRYLSDPKATLLLMSYQAEGTLGRKIQSHARSVSINGEQIPVRCVVDQLDSYSAHGDQNKLLRWMVSGPQKPGRVMVVHADPPSAQEFATLVHAKHGVTVDIARLGQVVEV